MSEELKEAVNPDVVQDGMEQTIDSKLIEQYYEANTKKNEGEKETKALKPRIVAALAAIGKVATNVGGFSVSYKPKSMTVCKDKVGYIKMLQEKAPECLYLAVDDKILEQALADGKVTIEEISVFHGQEPGSAALIIKPLKKGEE